MYDSTEMSKRHSTEEAATEKIYAAEKHIAVIRLAIVLFNSGVFLCVMERAGTMPWLAYLIIAASCTYSLAVLLFEPYRRFSVLLSSHFSSGAPDGLHLYRGHSGRESCPRGLPADAR
jgi:hypothetical protein